VPRQIISTQRAPSSPLYSQGVRIGNTIYVSGMTGFDVTTQALAGPSIQAQTVQALRNCTAIVEVGGGTQDDIAQVTVLLANPDDFAGMNQAYATVFTTEPPTRAVAKLGVELPGILVSILLTAHLSV
jgi:2-iminobutanoate/2-iminopropanoate deaminase